MNYGLVNGIRATPALPVSADKGTLLGFAVCRVRPLSALTPSSSPTRWARGAAREPVWSAEALASASGGSSAAALPIPLSRLAREGDKGGEGNTAACPSTPAREKSPLLQRLRAEPLYPYQGEGREWGDSARAGICELWLGDW